jgi:glutaredoxin
VRVLRTDPTLGPAHASVTIVEFSDFQCPFCKRAEATVDELRRLYPGKLRVVFKQLPMPMHPQAELAAEASLAAAAQGKFWPFHDLLFADQDELSPATIMRDARAAGLDMKKLRAALEQHRYRPAVEADVATPAPSTPGTGGGGRTGRRSGRRTTPASTAAAPTSAFTCYPRRAGRPRPGRSGDPRCRKPSSDPRCPTCPGRSGRAA